MCEGGCSSPLGNTDDGYEPGLDGIVDFVTTDM
jgi:hypothetical protein